MKKVVTKLFYNLGGVIASFAVAITALNVNTTCMFIANQPSIPEDAKRLRKF